MENAFPSRRGVIERDQSRVTLMLLDYIEQPWPLYLSADCARFIGRYALMPQFGPKSGLLHYLPGTVA